MNEKKNLTIKETFALAVKNQQKNNIQVAENLYKEILKISPNHTDAHNNLGIILLQLEKLREAKSFFQKATQINPNYVSAHNNLGAVFYETGELQKAISCYEKAIQINPNYAEAHNNLGAIFRKLGEHQKAISCYEKAIQINPNYAAAYNNIGNAYIKLEDYGKAIEYCNIALTKAKSFEKEKYYLSLENSKKELERKNILNLINNNSICAEIGVNEGEFSEKILKQLPKELHLVDSWLRGGMHKISNNKTSVLSQENMDQIHKSVKKKFTNKKNVYVHKLSSLEASKLFNKNYFDFVYIDASHSYEDVKLDLETWFPKIKKDGLLTGDDYYEPSKFSFTYGYGVIKAVDEFVKKNALDENFYTKGTQYIIQKN